MKFSMSMIQGFLLSFFLFKDLSDDIGHLTFVRRGTNSIESYEEGVSLGDKTSGIGGSLPDLEVYLAARNDSDTAVTFSPNEYALWYAAVGLTDAEVSNINGRVATFQTALSRNV